MLALTRSWFFYIGLVPYTIFYSILSLLILPLPRSWRYWIITGWARFVILWLKLICGLSWRVQGLEHLPDVPSVILSKHQSAWETISFQLIFPRQCQVLKKELFKIPFFGWGLWSLNPIAIDRSAGVRALKQVLEEGRQRIADGWWVVLFPEGTRIAPGERGRYSQTGAALAAKAGCPIVPVAHNAGVFWRRNSVLKRPGCIDVMVGEPISPAGKTAKELTSEVEQWIEAACSSLANSSSNEALSTEK
ncbi:MAG: lysophospholipid acyltransferase family protein [Pseudomonadota bacterium]